MIKLIKDADDVLGNNVFACKIRSNMLSYGECPFMFTWAQNSDTYIQKFSNSLTISIGENTDYEELRSFIDTIGYDTVFTDMTTAEKFGLDIIDGGTVMKLKDFIPTYFDTHTQIVYPEYKIIYKLLKMLEFPVPNYDMFLTDFSHRVRHNSARVVSDNTYTSVSFTAWEDKHSAVISAVAVIPQIQHTGQGSKALQSLCHLLLKDKRDIYLYRRLDTLEEFYNKNGFYNVGLYVTARKGTNNEHNV